METEPNFQVQLFLSLICLFIVLTTLACIFGCCIYCVSHSQQVNNFYQATGTRDSTIHTDNRREIQLKPIIRNTSAKTSDKPENLEVKRENLEAIKVTSPE